MINHARTLILNQPASRFEGITGAEYIPTEYVPAALDPLLERLRRVFVPTGLDPYGELFVMRSLTTLLHQPEIEPYTLQLDPRVTYSPGDLSLGTVLDAPVVTDFRRTAACDIEPEYALELDSLPGNLATAGYHRWDITRVTDLTVQVQYNRAADQVVQILAAPAVGYTDRLELIPDYLSARFEVPSGTLTGDFRYRVEAVVAVPYTNIGARMAAVERELGREDLAVRVFDRFPELRTIYYQSKDTAWALGAVLVGTATAIDAARGVRT